MKLLQKSKNTPVSLDMKGVKSIYNAGVWSDGQSPYGHTAFHQGQEIHSNDEAF